MLRICLLRVSADLRIHLQRYWWSSLDHSAYSLKEQANTHPDRRLLEKTRGVSILFFSNTPSLIHFSISVTVISEHEMILTEVELRAKIAKRLPRPVFNFNRVDYQPTRNGMNQFASSFLVRNEFCSRTIETNWIMFKNELLDLITAHIPPRNL